MQFEFETSRLVCRRWVPGDVDAIYAVYSDEEGARYVDDGKPIEFSECERWIDVTLQNYEQRGYGMFALDDKVTGDTIGFVGLIHPGGQEEAEIKYSFLKSHWGNGLASEVVPATLAYASETHGLKKVIATVAEENVPSQKVLQKAGMRFVKSYAEDDSETYLYEWRVE